MPTISQPNRPGRKAMHNKAVARIGRLAKPVPEAALIQR